MDGVNKNDTYRIWNLVYQKRVIPAVSSPQWRTLTSHLKIGVAKVSDVENGSIKYQSCSTSFRVTAVVRPSASLSRLGEESGGTSLAVAVLRFHIYLLPSVGLFGLGTVDLIDQWRDGPRQRSRTSHSVYQVRCTRFSVRRYVFG